MGGQGGCDTELKFCENSKIFIYFFFWGGGDCRVGFVWVRVGVNEELNILGKLKKKRFFFFLGGGRGVRVDGGGGQKQGGGGSAWM